MISPPNLNAVSRYHRSTTGNDTARFKAQKQELMRPERFMLESHRDILTELQILAIKKNQTPSSPKTPFRIIAKRQIPIEFGSTDSV